MFGLHDSQLFWSVVSEKQLSILSRTRTILSWFCGCNILSGIQEKTGRTQLLWKKFTYWIRSWNGLPPSSFPKLTSPKLFCVQCGNGKNRSHGIRKSYGLRDHHHGRCSWSKTLMSLDKFVDGNGITVSLCSPCGGDLDTESKEQFSWGAD